MYHAILTLVFIIFAFLFNLSPITYLFPSCFYIGREYTQAEYRYIDSHGGHRDKCPYYCGLLPSSWTVKSILDWFLPFLITIICILIQKYFF